MLGRSTGDSQSRSEDGYHTTRFRVVGFRPVLGKDGRPTFLSVAYPHRPIESEPLSINREVALSFNRMYLIAICLVAGTDPQSCAIQIAMMRVGIFYWLKPAIGQPKRYGKFSFRILQHFPQYESGNGNVKTPCELPLLLNVLCLKPVEACIQRKFCHLFFLRHSNKMTGRFDT